MIAGSSPEDTTSVGRGLVATNVSNGNVKLGRKLAAADIIEGTA